MKHVTSKVKQVPVLKQAAKISVTTEHYSEALEYLRTTHQAEDESVPDTFADMAKCIYELGDIDQIRDEGMKLVEQSLMLNKEHAPTWLNRGCLELAQGMDS